jgi:hypothetical protein
MVKNKQINKQTNKLVAHNKQEQVIKREVKNLKVIIVAEL